MRIVFTNGCFDILHRGHIELFKYAKSLGDVLYVGLDSDEKVRQDKGLDRPINSMEDRKLILDSLLYIDKVFCFSTRDELIELVRKISPDVMVIGSDWKNKPVVGSEYTNELIFFNRIDGYSTTNIIKAI